MTCFEKWDLAFNAIIAVGTVGAVVLALFGDWIKNRIIRANLSVRIVNPKGELTHWNDGTKKIYYHLIIINRRPSIQVQQCRVFLNRIYKKNDDGKFTELELAVPPTLQWAPAESSPQAIDFISKRVLDFGFLAEGSDKFSPSINPRWNNFNGNLKRNETFRYEIEVVANNAASQIVTIEVFWDGTWNVDLDQMINAFKIRIL